MRQHVPTKRFLALLAGLTLIAASCGDDGDDDVEAEDGETEAAGKLIYFVEGNMTAELDVEPGALVGVRGTIPGAEVPEEFLGRLQEQNADLNTYTYGPETYDAVIILALAAQAAGTDRADEVARQINGVTREGTKCATFEECKGLLDEGEDIDYDGQSGPVDFAQPGEPAAANFGVYNWNEDNTLNTEDVEFFDIQLFPEGEEPEVEEDASEELQALAGTGDADPECTSENEDGVFDIGGLLAETGNLGDILGAPQIAGAELAVQDVNDAGGVLDEDLQFNQTDSGEETPDVATPAVEDHLSDGANAILGASASGVSSNVIEQIVDSCTIMFSPSNTGLIFITYEDDGLYFRTAASDILQGQVLADVALEDGAETAVIMAIQDPYGEGLAESVAVRFEDSGGDVLETIFYDPEASDFGAEIDQVVSADPDAFVLVGFAESAQIYQTLIEAGFTPGG